MTAVYCLYMDECMRHFSAHAIDMAVGNDTMPEALLLVTSIGGGLFGMCV